MPDVSDMELLRHYDRQGSEEAFAELVRRHINLVYSVALRHLGIAAHAEEITQAVFVILARKAASLRPDTILPGWLHETTRLVSLSFLRGERRRQFREQEAYMQSTLPETTDTSTWNQLAPLLDEAMSRLGKKDRDAVVLRFFKEKNLNEVAATLKVTNAAAQRRVHRALEKLRQYFKKRGVSSTTAIIASAISANSVQAAPTTLAQSVTAVAIAKGAAASSSTLTLIKGVLKVMAWTKLKVAVLTCAGVLLASSVAVVAVEVTHSALRNATDQRIWSEYSQVFAQDMSGPEMRNAADKVMASHPPVALIRLAHPPPTRLAFGQRGRISGITTPRGSVLIGAYLVDVLRYAYGLGSRFLQNRVVVPHDFIYTRFDMVDTMPKGGRETLQRALKEQFGLTARREMRGNLVLTLKSHSAGDLHRHTNDAAAEAYKVHDVTMAELSGALSKLLGVQVTDQTGLPGGYDYSLDAPPNPTADEIKEALSEMGLELAPASDNQLVEFLVAQKVPR